MPRWFRVYDDLVDDPKVQRLPAELFKAIINLWCLASQNGGVLPALDDIAFKLRIKSDKLYTLMTALRNAGLLDDDETGTHPHNWQSRQFKSDVSNERVKRFRERQKAVTGNAGVTLHETPPEADTEQKQSRAEKKDGAAAPISAEKELFDRGKAVLGVKAGGLIAKLLKAKDGNVALARAAIETASTKQQPGEYIGAIVRGKNDQAAQPYNPII